MRDEDRKSKMTRQEYKKKLERGIAQVRAGLGIVKTMEELESMTEEKISPDSVTRPGRR